MPFTYDTRLGRYRDEAGRLVSEARIRLAVDQVADAASDIMADVTERLRRGELRLAEWQVEMMRTVKQAHVAAGVAAQGGRLQMTPSAFGFLGSEIKEQYRYLRDFANAIEAGTVSLDNRLVVARAAMYGQHTRVTYEAIRARDAQNRGYVMERNVLHAQESCAQCVSLARLSWVDVGSLPPIGSRTCLSRCRCTISRRKTIPDTGPLRVVA